MRTLLIGNKCYSSWSLRAWLLLKELDIPFQEKQILLDRPDTVANVKQYSPAGRVPVLIDEGVTVWDSLAIVEHVAETTDAHVWPTGPAARAMARSICAEMHSGFPHLRSGLPMNLGKTHAYRERPEAAGDIARVFEIFTQARTRHGEGGPFLFGRFTAADAYFAPVVARLEGYSVPVDATVRAYMDAVLGLASFQDWRKAALAEPWVLASDEVPDEAIVDHRAGVAKATAPAP